MAIERPHKTAAVLLFAAVLLVGGTPLRVLAQADCAGEASTSTSCQEGGNAGSPGDGDSSGGGASSGNGAGGGEGGQGGAGIDEPDPTARPAPAAPAPAHAPATGGSRSSSSSAQSSSRSSDASVNDAVATPPDERVAAWAQRFGTTPEEVQSWFGTYSPEDTIVGAGSGKTLRPDEELTISDRSAVQSLSGTPNNPLLDGANRVDISLHSVAVPLGTTTTDKNGIFSATVRIPSSTSGGKHFIVALAPNRKGGMAAFVFPVTVQADAAAADTTFNSIESQAATTKHTPWMLVEIIAGAILVISLFVARVRRASAAAR